MRVNVRELFNLDNYIVIRNMSEHRIFTDDGEAFPASREMHAGRLNVWSYAARAGGDDAADGKHSGWELAV
jgi:hypothetical protein